MNPAMESDQLAVIVQGPCVPATLATLAGVRLYLPGARIVLSTWEGADTSVLGLDPSVDDIVLSADPGSFSCTSDQDVPGPPININRMIVSTLAGLRRAERPWTIKIRTDAVVEHAGVLRLMKELPAATGEWALFTRLVGVSSVYTRNPFKTPAGSFHPADTVQFGRTDDLLLLWDVPPMPESDAMYFSDPSTRPAWCVTSQRYFSEQWVFLNALRTRYEIDFEHRAVFTADLMQVSNRALAQNFFVAEPWQIGIRVPHLDRQLRWGEDPICVMTHPIWQQLRHEALLPVPADPR